MKKLSVLVLSLMIFICMTTTASAFSVLPNAYITTKYISGSYYLSGFGSALSSDTYSEVIDVTRVHVKVYSGFSSSGYSQVDGGWDEGQYYANWDMPEQTHYRMQFNSLEAHGYLYWFDGPQYRHDYDWTIDYV